MSGVDPLAALAAQAVANAQAAINAATLSLGADVAALQAQISVGDVIAATVLPPQGGTDLLSFLGQTVAAQIPPGINPGETLLLQVTGFTNSTVTVQNLGVIDPENPIPTVNVELAQPPAEGPQTAVLTTQIAPPASGTAPAASAPAPQPVAMQLPPVPAPQPGPSAVPSSSVSPPANVAPLPNVAPSPNVAPPREVFVAASVRPNLGGDARALAGQIEEAIARNDVEARLAANRASSPAPPAGASATPQGPAVKNASTPPAVTNGAQPASRFPVAPPIVRPAGAPDLADAPSSVAAAPRAVTPSTPEAALLTRLGLPISAVTLAAARLIGTATQNVTTTYARLESLLAKLSPEDAGVLRSMLAFAGKFDLRNTQALPEQIATFISDVLDGAEAKIVQAVRLWSQLEVPPPTEETTPGVAGQPQPASAAAASAAPLAAAIAEELTPNVVGAAAQAAERVAAMDYDVKSAILAMIAGTGASGSPQLAGALREALTATTALQLNVLAAQNNDPRTITIPLPAYFYEGGDPVHLQISRDAPKGKNPMDADNFHIAFILDTKSLGTVAIDLQTVGRAVSVDVKTQANVAADRFRSTLGDLRSRLEGLHYRISTIGAGVAPPSGAEPPQTAQPAAPLERKSFWDTRA
jgi:hypothetical protein